MIILSSSSGPGFTKGSSSTLTRCVAQGTQVVLVSSSPGLVIEPLSIYLGCSDTITTPVLIERGRLVGMGRGPPVLRRGKMALGPSAGRPIAESRWTIRSRMRIIGVTGPCWNASGRAVVVNPRGKLLRLARARGWHIARPRRPRRFASGPGRWRNAYATQRVDWPDVGSGASPLVSIVLLQYEKPGNE